MFFVAQFRNHLCVNQCYTYLCVYVKHVRITLVTKVNVEAKVSL